MKDFCLFDSMILGRFVYQFFIYSVLLFSIRSFLSHFSTSSTLNHFTRIRSSFYSSSSMRFMKNISLLVFQVKPQKWHVIILFSSFWTLNGFSFKIEKIFNDDNNSNNTINLNKRNVHINLGENVSNLSDVIIIISAKNILKSKLRLSMDLNKIETLITGRTTSKQQK